MLRRFCFDRIGYWSVTGLIPKDTFRVLIILFGGKTVVASNPEIEMGDPSSRPHLEPEVIELAQAHIKRLLEDAIDTMKSTLKFLFFVRGHV
jgi:hypothetical protein